MIETQNKNTLLKLQGITKTFGKVVANSDINLELHEGEVLALLGENGAGKSTLMNIIYGIYKPDAGKIEIRGKETNKIGEDFDTDYEWIKKGYVTITPLIYDKTDVKSLEILKKEF